MKKLLIIVVVSLFALSLTACGAKASKEDCAAACTKVFELGQAAIKVPPAADPTAEIDKQFADQLAAAKKEKDDALAAIDKELQDKLAAVKEPAKKAKKAKGPTPEEEKANLTKDYGAKKEAKAKELDEKIAGIDKQKAEALKVAKEAKDKVAAAEKDAREKAVAGCADACVKNNLKKSVTDCQLKAASLDDVAKCAK
jgi:hypothetical protein